MGMGGRTFGLIFTGLTLLSAGFRLCWAEPLYSQVKPRENTAPSPDPRNLPGVYVGSVYLRKLDRMSFKGTHLLSKSAIVRARIAKGQLMVLVIRAKGTCEVFWSNPKDRRVSSPKATGKMTWNKYAQGLVVNLESLEPSSAIHADGIDGSETFHANGDILQLNDLVGFISCKKDSPAKWHLEATVSRPMTTTEKLRTQWDTVHPYPTGEFVTGPRPPLASLSGVYAGEPRFSSSIGSYLNKGNYNNFYGALLMRTRKRWIYFLGLYPGGHSRSGWFDPKTGQYALGPFVGSWSTRIMGNALYVDVEGLPQEGRLVPDRLQEYRAVRSFLQLGDAHTFTLLSKSVKPSAR